MKTRGQFSLSVLTACVALFAACSNGESTSPATLKAIAVSPATVTLQVGKTQTLTAIGTFSDDSTRPLTSDLTWSSTPQSVATVDGNGVIQAVSAGQATITVNSSGLQAQATVTVIAAQATLTSITVEPSPLTLLVNATQQLTVAGHYSDGSGAALSTGISFVSNATDVADVDASGLVTAKKAGGAVITVTVGDKQATVQVTVTAATLVALTVDPATSTIFVGKTQQLTVTGKFNDDTTATLSGGLTYTSSNQAVATVSTTGLVTGIAAGGPVTITVASGQISNTASVTVKAPAVTSIAVTPKTPSVTVGSTVTLAVTATMDDGSHPTLTSGVTFASNHTDIATVDNAGVVTGVAEGSATITATHTASGKSDTATATVTNAPVAIGHVFWGDYYDATFQPFGGSDNTGLSRDTTETYQGRATLKIAIPGSGYTGGTIVAKTPRDLSGFDVVSFWAKASADFTFDKFGLGNDAGSSLFAAERQAIALTTTWTKYYVPIPLASKLTANTGLFHFAQGAKAGFTAWIADVQYEQVGSSMITLDVSAASPAIRNGGSPTVSLGIGGTFTMPDGESFALFRQAGVADPIKINPISNRYFTFEANPTGVVTFTDAGVFTAAAAGTTTITAKLGSAAVQGSTIVTIGAAIPGPTTQAAAPTAPAADVLSLFSATYAGTAADKSANVETWLTPWSGGGSAVIDYTIPSTSHVVKKYTLSNYVGIEFVGGGNDPQNPALGTKEIDAATGGYTHFHMDIWSPDATHFIVKLHDAGADKVVGTGDDSEILYPVILNAQNQWTAIDADFSAFQTVLGTFSGKHLAQMILVEDGPAAGGTTYVDNIYFTRTAAPAQVPAAAPTAPTAAAADALSLFSATYAGTSADKSANVDTWRTPWSATGSVSDYTITGTSHVVKKYVLGNFAGIEFIGTNGAHELDVGTPGLNKFHMDIWSPDATHFTVKLHDAGADKGVGAGTDDSEILLPVIVTAQNQWISIDSDLSAFQTIQGTWDGKHVAQLILVQDGPAAGGTTFVDNIYFYKTTAPANAPTSNAAAPTQPAANVMSIFSSTYTGTAADMSAKVDTYNATCFGSGGTVTDYSVPGGHTVKKYVQSGAGYFAIIRTTGSNGDVCAGGTQTGTNLLNLGTMTHVHFDVWAPNGTGNLQLALVDAGADGQYGGGPGAAAGTGADDSWKGTGAFSVAQGTWVSFDLALATDLGAGGPSNLQHVALIKLFSVDSGPFFIDNLYFHK